MMSGKDLNVVVNPMDPPINCLLQRNMRVAEIKTLVGNNFRKLKQVNTELIVVIIPDAPAGVYGKK